MSHLDLARLPRPLMSPALAAAGAVDLDLDLQFSPARLRGSVAARALGNAVDAKFDLPASWPPTGSLERDSCAPEAGADDQRDRRGGRGPHGGRRDRSALVARPAREGPAVGDRRRRRRPPAGRRGAQGPFPPDLRARAGRRWTWRSAEMTIGRSPSRSTPRRPACRPPSSRPPRRSRSGPCFVVAPTPRRSRARRSRSTATSRRFRSPCSGSWSDGAPVFSGGTISLQLAARGSAVDPTGTLAIDLTGATTGALPRHRRAGRAEGRSEGHGGQRPHCADRAPAAGAAGALRRRAGGPRGPKPAPRRSTSPARRRRSSQDAAARSAGRSGQRRTKRDTPGCLGWDPACRSLDRRNVAGAAPRGPRAGQRPEARSNADRLRTSSKRHYADGKSRVTAQVVSANGGQLTLEASSTADLGTARDPRAPPRSRAVAVRAAAAGAEARPARALRPDHDPPPRGRSVRRRPERAR